MFPHDSKEHFPPANIQQKHLLVKCFEGLIRS